jgi:membrane associated rhomboid family serine protease
VVQREKERYGGIKWGSAFFGWLTATGTAVILTALLAAAGTAVGVANDTSAGEAARQADTIGIIGGIALLLVLLIAYYCGGYVAGRMARFNGVKQGIAVWLWALAIAVVVAVTGALLGTKFDVLARLNGFPRIPVNEGALTTGGLIAILVAVAAALVGAVSGGLAGMRFHRKVDKAGLGH